MSLFEFEESEKPEIKVKKKIDISVKGEIRLVGLLGINEKTNNYCFISDRKKTGMKKHYFEKVGGYPIAIEVLQRIEHWQVKEIFINEKDTDKMYEFSFLDYVHGEHIQEDDFEPQKCIPVDSARREWDNGSIDEVIIE